MYFGHPCVQSREPIVATPCSEADYTNLGYLENLFFSPFPPECDGRQQILKMLAPQSLLDMHPCKLLVNLHKSYSRYKASYKMHFSYFRHFPTGQDFHKIPGRGLKEMLLEVLEDIDHLQDDHCYPNQ